MGRTVTVKLKWMSTFTFGIQLESSIGLPRPMVITKNVLLHNFKSVKRFATQSFELYYKPPLLLPEVNCECFYRTLKMQST